MLTVAGKIEAVIETFANISAGAEIAKELVVTKVTELLAPVVGAAHESEVAAMNSLTTNIHMLFAAFYRPSGGRGAILIEAHAFPSDRYAAFSQLAHHGYDPDEFCIEVEPRADDGLLHTEDIIGSIDANWERTALVWLGGVNYLSGQVSRK